MAIIEFLFSMCYIDERVGAVHLTLNKTPLVNSFFDIVAIQNLVMIELPIWKQAYGWMHPMLDIEKVFPVS
jgi:hypothetical protein